MKRINLFKALAAAALIALGQCSVEPIYHTEVTGEVYDQSSGTSAESAQIGVWQILAIPFDHLKDYHGRLPMTSLTASNTLTTDEILMPNRNGDWYDGGFYLNHWYHKWNSTTEGYWVYAVLIDLMLRLCNEPIYQRLSYSRGYCGLHSVAIVSLLRL